MLAGSNVPEDRIKGFALATIDGRGCMERIIEKPDDATLAALPKPLWLSMNLWRLGPSIFEAAGRSNRRREATRIARRRTIYHREPWRNLSGGNHSRPVLDMTSRADIAPVAAILTRIEVRL